MHLFLLRYHRWVLVNRCLHHPAWAECCPHRYDHPECCDVNRTDYFRAWVHECMPLLVTGWLLPTEMRMGIESVHGESRLHPTEIHLLSTNRGLRNRSRPNTTRKRNLPTG
uniref:Putative secreted protein n=1 Tax=Anopheles darlingi TaxID=43151 RepID=A0A2M4DLA5_ANODA